MEMMTEHSRAHRSKHVVYYAFPVVVAVVAAVFAVGLSVGYAVKIKAQPPVESKFSRLMEEVDLEEDRVVASAEVIGFGELALRIAANADSAAMEQVMDPVAYLDEAYPPVTGAPNVLPTGLPTPQPRVGGRVTPFPTIQLPIRQPTQSPSGSAPTDVPSTTPLSPSPVPSLPIETAYITFEPESRTIPEVIAEVRYNPQETTVVEFMENYDMDGTSINHDPDRGIMRVLVKIDYHLSPLQGPINLFALRYQSSHTSPFAIEVLSGDAGLELP